MSQGAKEYVSAKARDLTAQGEALLAAVHIQAGGGRPGSSAAGLCLPRSSPAVNKYRASLSSQHSKSQKGRTRSRLQADVQQQQEVQQQNVQQQDVQQQDVQQQLTQPEQLQVRTLSSNGSRSFSSR